jgi:hypothetical protein
MINLDQVPLKLHIRSLMTLLNFIIVNYCLQLTKLTAVELVIN